MLSGKRGKKKAIFLPQSDDSYCSGDGQKPSDHATDNDKEDPKAPSDGEKTRSEEDLFWFLAWSMKSDVSHRDRRHKLWQERAPQELGNDPTDVSDSDLSWREQGEEEEKQDLYNRYADADPLAQKYIAEVVDNGPGTPKEIAAVLGVSSAVIYNTVRRLKRRVNGAQDSPA